MSVVTVQLGQCGNQIGSQVFQALARDGMGRGGEGRARIGGGGGGGFKGSYGEGEIWETFFRECEIDDRRSERSSGHASGGEAIARAVLVDMEPKVVRSVMSSVRSYEGCPSGWAYGDNNFFSRDSGSGNNWARGYYVHGPRCRDPIMEVIRREVEACDNFGGFLLLQSAAGGTGSGVGAYIAGALKEEYPSSCLLSHCVWPYESGEVIVQSYNVPLTISHLYNEADGIIVCPNDALQATCRQLFNSQRVSFKELNDVAARSLSSVLLPSFVRDVSSSITEDCTSTSGGRHKLHLLADVASHLCAHPGYKLLTIRCLPQIPTPSIPFTTFSWGGILKSLKQMHVRGSLIEHGLDWTTPPGLLSSFYHAETTPTCGWKIEGGGQGVERGAGGGGGRGGGGGVGGEGIVEQSPGTMSSTSSANRALASMLFLRGNEAMVVDASMFVDPSLHPLWASDPLVVAAHPACANKYEMSASLLTNCKSVVTRVERMVERSYDLFSTKAYLHQYHAFGMEESDFEEVYTSLEDIVARYRML
ncbi:hypothetical protein CBR_g17937 [Chara braunii]|uniref:Tubulin delta chain n=1 Tax=Chara braunii TaxID=69332 RepID=A0A388KVX7_CHABU|nr:hypothetical protein CBR_g17937 [Chara braunii]|eukprot:GBG74225.1 hypothetical protein CBR_g17937 [Chara braunii]